MGGSGGRDEDYVQKAAEMLILNEGSEARARALAKAEAMLAAGRPHVGSVWKRIAEAVERLANRSS